MPTHTKNYPSTHLALLRWQVDQASRVVAHAINEGGAGTRLMTHIAVSSTPEDPWVTPPAHVSDAMFAAPRRGAGSKLVTRLIDKGLIAEDPHRPHRNAPRRVRLNLVCNALCRPGEHVMDTTAASIAEWLEITEAQIADRIEALDASDPALGDTYRRLLIDSCRHTLEPLSCPVDDGAAGIELTARGLIREHKSDTHRRYLPVPAPKLPDGGDH